MRTMHAKCNNRQTLKRLDPMMPLTRPYPYNAQNETPYDKKTLPR